MIYKKCTHRYNHDDLDTYMTNDLGFLELVYCANKTKEEKQAARY
jgi:hypothetical protein